MEPQRVRTPPILDWAVISVSGSSDEEVDLNLPFETLESAILKTQKLICSEWANKPSSCIEIHQGALESSDPFKNERPPRSSLETICQEIAKDIKNISKESEIQEDYIEQFRKFEAINNKIES
ncbi:hypothetical protein SteCoe_32106 [Stentor coeruleus]|uniref:Uncharacterized protein n=1 Tax=Stentor coeruleus TaxID=5963 RepID=A0A1R2AZT2_9CILI|nr:hypothetical protein SteCoe_32106 [Stentor coeruleus]